MATVNYRKDGTVKSITGTPDEIAEIRSWKVGKNHEDQLRDSEDQFEPNTSSASPSPPRRKGPGNPGITNEQHAARKQRCQELFDALPEDMGKTDKYRRIAEEFNRLKDAGEMDEEFLEEIGYTPFDMMGDHVFKWSWVRDCLKWAED